MAIIKQLIDKKILKILDLLLKNKNKFFHLSEISNNAKVPIASTFRIISKLVSLNLVEISVIGKMKIYKIADYKKTKELELIIKK